MHRIQLQKLLKENNNVRVEEAGSHLSLLSLLLLRCPE